MISANIFTPGPVIAALMAKYPGYLSAVDTQRSVLADMMETGKLDFIDRDVVTIIDSGNPDISYEVRLDMMPAEDDAGIHIACNRAVALYVDKRQICYFIESASAVLPTDRSTKGAEAKLNCSLTFYGAKATNLPGVLQDTLIGEGLGKLVELPEDLIGLTHVPMTKIETDLITLDCRAWEAELLQGHEQVGRKLRYP